MSINYKETIDAIKQVLLDNNTTTSSHDLSKNLESRINLVTKNNPAYIFTQNSALPAVFVRLDSNDITFEGMSRNQASTSKLTEMSYSIIGMLWNTKYVDLENDNSDDQIRYLAENVEQVLRNNPGLSNTCLYSYPESIEFYDDLGEESHLKTFMMKYKVKKYY